MAKASLASGMAHSSVHRDPSNDRSIELATTLQLQSILFAAVLFDELTPGLGKLFD